MVTRTLAAMAAVGLLASSAFAAKLPAWNIEDVCRGDSAPGQCSLFEARARNAISASWDLLPSEIQEACITGTSDPADHSWRTLADCIEVEVLRAKEKRAIATRSTPAEPAPTAPVMAEPPATEATAAETQPTEAMSETAPAPVPPAAPAEPANATQP